MKRSLVLLGLLTTIFISGQSSFASCPCQSPCQTEPTPPPAATEPCNKCEKPTCSSCNETWTDSQKMEEYFCQIGLSDCQKDEARKLVEEFKCNTQGLNGGDCENKCDCRKYRKELRHLDREMKKLLTECQKSNYAEVRSDVKSQVKCCHKCLIWPSLQKKCSSCN